MYAFYRHIVLFIDEANWQSNQNTDNLHVFTSVFSSELNPDYRTGKSWGCLFCLPLVAVKIENPIEGSSYVNVYKILTPRHYKKNAQNWLKSANSGP